jgi:hypothetical protein
LTDAPALPSALQREADALATMKQKKESKLAKSGAFYHRAGPRATVFARCTPFLEDFSRARFSAPAPRSVSPRDAD